jgi:hypothetical protein
MTDLPSMLLVQPLNIEDIDIHIKEDEQEHAQPPPSVITNQIPQVSPVIDMIDDAELLAILGLSPMTMSAMASPVSLDDCLLNWDHMPDLLSDESESVVSTSTKKRKQDDDELFALFDFEEFEPINPSKKTRLTTDNNQQEQADFMATLQQNEPHKNSLLD